MVNITFKKEVSEKISYALDLVEELGVHFEHLKALNDILYDYTCGSCSIEKSSGELYVNARELVRNQPRINILCSLVGERLEMLREAQDNALELLYELHYTSVDDMVEDMSQALTED